MPNVRVQSNNGALGSGASDTLSVSLSPSQHNLFIICACSFNGGPLTVTDNLTSTYSLAASDSDVGNSRAWAGLWYLKNIPSGITSVTVSGFAFGLGEVELIEYSGLDQTSPLDQASAHNSGFSTPTFTSNTTGTTSQAGELVVAYVGSPYSTDGAFSGISGAFTTFDEVGPIGNGHYICAEQLSASVAAYTFSGSNSGTNVDNTAVIAAFKSGTPPPGFVTQYMDSIVWF